MTKDLALLIGPDQRWQTTEEFLASIDENLQRGDGLNPHYLSALRLRRHPNALRRTTW